uniref:Putative 50 kDa protein in type I retrotransposable element R1DM n=1 Tax=Lygus hesperus TaxID=30085 RepID=A0A0A9VUJ5_LYGHE
MVQAVMDLALQMGILHGRLVEAKQGKDSLQSSLEANTLTILDMVSKSSFAPKSDNKSYAEVMKAKKISIPLRSDNTVVMYPIDNNSNITPAEIEKEVRQAVNPVTTKIKIENMRTIGNKGLLVRTAQKDNLTSLLDCQKLKDSGIKVSVPNKKMPRLAVYNVPQDLDDDQFISALGGQNDLEEDFLKKNMKCAFKFGRKDRASVHRVIEVSPELRKKLLSKERVYIFWTSCHVEDYLHISRCYTCHGFNHVSKTCKATTQVCGHCAEVGHDFNSCTKRELKACCANCKKYNLPHEHDVRDKTCPTYLNALTGIRNRTDFGI